jgi:hypothetical protein
VTDLTLKRLVTPRRVGQPWRTFYQPVRASNVLPDIPIAYIGCSGQGSDELPFLACMEKMKTLGVKTDTIRTGHSCILMAPGMTTKLLVKYATSDKTGQARHAKSEEQEVSRATPSMLASPLRGRTAA